MEDQNNMQGKEPDAHEKLRMENELLKAKIIAQFGGSYEDFDQGLPPEIENQFLKNVIAFEEQHEEYKPVKIAALLGDPVFEKEENLDDGMFEKEWNRLKQSLEEKRIGVDFIRARDDRFKYKFITEELFDHETDGGMMGMGWNFIYEEFHPDHEREIVDRTEEFMKAWFERDTEFAEHYLASHFIQPDRQILSREELLKKMQVIFDSYPAFENYKYKILEVKFQLQESEHTQGLGHAEGAVRYEALLENGERKKIEGPFKLYMSREYDWWSIFYFVMAGFNE